MPRTKGDVFLLESMNLDPDDLRRWASACPDVLPGRYHPEKFGTHEVPRKSNSWPMTDRAKYEELLIRHNGCFLHGKGWMIDLTISSSSNVASTCILWLKSYSSYHLESILHVVQSLAQHNCYYAFGASWAEYRARNGYTTMGLLGRGEGWAGRAFRRYVPGLYWLNYFSQQYTREMCIPLDSIVSELGAAQMVLSDGVLLRLYEHPERWTEFEPSVAAYLRTHQPFFSISSVKMPDRLLGPREDLEWSRQIHKDWP